MKAKLFLKNTLERRRKYYARWHSQFFISKKKNDTTNDMIVIIISFAKAKKAAGPGEGQLNRSQTPNWVWYKIGFLGGGFVKLALLWSTNTPHWAGTYWPWFLLDDKQSRWCGLCPYAQISNGGKIKIDTEKTACLTTRWGFWAESFSAKKNRWNRRTKWLIHCVIDQMMTLNDHCCKLKTHHILAQWELQLYWPAKNMYGHINPKHLQKNYPP